MPLVLEYALRCLVSEHQRISELEPQAHAWQQQEQRGDMIGAKSQPLPTPAAGYEQARSKLRAQFSLVQNLLDASGVQIDPELQLEIRRAGLL